MTTQSTGIDVLDIIFQNQITEQGLMELRERYPSNLVIDMSNDDEFKKARKVRTELNKLKKAIGDRRIEISSNIKSKADSLISEIEKIYSVVVTPFEAEDKRRKEAKALEERKRAEKLAKQREEINGIRQFVTTCEGASLSKISDCIEAVDNIDTSIFDKELIHEAIEAKESTLKMLFKMHAQTKADEELAVQREALDKQMALTELALLPTQMIGHSAEELQSKIDELEQKVITKAEFDNVEFAQQTLGITVKQLQQLLSEAIAKQASLPKPTPAPAANDEALTESAVSESQVHTYKFLDIWPSDTERQENQELNRICSQLEQAENYIEFMQSQKAA